MPVSRFDAGVEILGPPKKTAQGYLRLDARLAKAGVQVYASTRAEYRPATEVFHADSLASYAHAAVTDEHPPEMLTPENTARYAKGHVMEDVRRDGDYVRASILVTDADLIRQMKRGKVELSAGYVVNLDEQPGVTPDGQRYDAIQRAIRVNHLSVVSKARAAGAAARVDSASKKENTMASVRIDSEDFEVPAEVARHVAALESERDSRRAVVRRDADFTSAVRRRVALERVGAEVLKNDRFDSMSDNQIRVALINALGSTPIPRDRLDSEEYLQMRLDAELHARSSNALAETRAAGELASRRDRASSTDAAESYRRKVADLWRQPVEGEFSKADAMKSLASK